jgi:OFA family oxalate/formate antiporter-like MFS transporter
MDGRKLAAALLICLCFGSIHAYGVLLAPIEDWLGTSRTVASLGYALAVVALTAGVYVNGRLEAAAGARLRIMGSGLVAALGLGLAGGASSAAGLLVGFGLLYGLANGIAYATSLALAASAMPGRESQAMGLATAAYGLGAVLCAQLFDAALGRLPVALILLSLAPVILAVCLAGAALISSKQPAPAAAARRHAATRPLLVLWFSYFLGAFAGLMVLAHAPAIAVWRDGGAAEAGLVSGLVSFGSVAGGYLGGITGAWLPGARGIALPLLVQAAALVTLPFVTGFAAIAAILGIAGLCYGVLIAVIPSEVRRIAGPDGFAASYGKVFSAWGLAGVAGPVTAGYLFDITLGYGTALVVAAALSLGSSLFIMGVGK